jgi:hypothetical protein
MERERGLYIHTYNTRRRDGSRRAKDRNDLKIEIQHDVSTGGHE